MIIHPLLHIVPDCQIKQKGQKNQNYSEQMCFSASSFHTPGICPNMSAKPPRVSLSSFTLWGMKGLSRKKSFLIP